MIFSFSTLGGCDQCLAHTCVHLEKSVSSLSRRTRRGPIKAIHDKTDPGERQILKHDYIYLTRAMCACPGTMPIDIWNVTLKLSLSRIAQFAVPIVIRVFFFPLWEFYIVHHEWLLPCCAKKVYSRKFLFYFYSRVRSVCCHIKAVIVRPQRSLCRPKKASRFALHRADYCITVYS